MLKGWGREGCTSRSGSLPTNVLLQQRASCKRRRKTMRAQLNPNCRQPTPPQPHSFHQQAGQTSSRLWSKSKLLHPYYLITNLSAFLCPFLGKWYSISLIFPSWLNWDAKFALHSVQTSPPPVFQWHFFFTSTWIVDTVILKWCDALGDIRAQQLGLPESGIALAHKKEETILCHRYSQAPCKRFTKLWKIQDICAVYGWRHSCHVQTLICKPFLGISFRLLIAGGTLTVTCKSTPTLHDLTIDFCHTKSPVFYGLFDFLKI